MLEKDSKTTDKYKIDQATAISVKNQRVEPERGDAYYRSELTVKVKIVGDRPLQFDDIEAIADYVHELKIEDPQTKLPIGE